MSFITEDIDPDPVAERPWTTLFHPNRNQWFLRIGAANLSREDRHLHNMVGRLTAQERDQLFRNISRIDINIARLDDGVHNVIKSALLLHFNQTNMAALQQQNPHRLYDVILQQDVTPIIPYGEVDEDGCAVCLYDVKVPIRSSPPQADPLQADPLQANPLQVDAWVTLECGHKLHHFCVLEHLQKQLQSTNACPSCRRRIYHFDLRIHLPQPQFARFDVATLRV